MVRWVGEEGAPSLTAHNWSGEAVVIRGRWFWVHSHDVGEHSTARSDEHDGALDDVIVVDDALYGQVDQHTCHQPDSEDGQQSPQDL